MKKKLIYTFRKDLRKRLKDPKFRKAWEESEPEYLLSCAIIEKRLAQQMSQRQLAKKMKTTQAVISRIESMNANPSLFLLKRLAEALDSKLILQFK
ncbi:transcriptional regulator [Candidatus Roizmanbacteria bacterium CG_4_10_14_0_2_um_filter_36_35]|uniref:Transcriptional regulator n=4 Tax=Candidatus Roizmaniibacteriota TaxID=1752723 RepID=A0A2M7BVX6_9BACT|nr:MAG: transcriptional regulator [Candidatus Roizmanbacteria bacterium CG11_big_fil_rev_8_21_14_0_20_35_14]PIV10675.1 MAG: transcriptional regulator [Candidatus Roizmanbacteria bacterium CG03_land_8_20_14_0_80_35_26]PIZ67627.1 MAG: transcriptional regulator [Candidatus Roizmanbacteria bacterium CG_4_10_14_0_2_um_filter_36_35]PJC32173.1 MAG: transcriptional regulator [Candidatus Roizmanbacteria bacterium CG_4_9_14_0_2_um_filter_36_12]